jgi:hypothetical protein
MGGSTLFIVRLLDEEWDLMKKGAKVGVLPVEGRREGKFAFSHV